MLTSYQLIDYNSKIRFLCIQVLQIYSALEWENKKPKLSLKKILKMTVAEQLCFNLKLCEIHIFNDYYRYWNNECLT